MNIKQCLLYVLLFNVVCLSAMERFEEEQIDRCVEDVRDRIDEETLGMSKNIPCRGFIGTCLSYWRSDDLIKPEEIISELEKIESYIALEDKKEIVFKKLIGKHKYVAWLIQDLVDDKLEEFKQVTGSTIDALYFVEHKNVFEKIVHERALEKLSYEESIINLVYNICDKTDVAFLYGSTHDTRLCFLNMSYDSKYLLSRDYQQNEIVWDMEKGKETNLSSKAIEWVFEDKPNEQAYFVKSNNYCAMSVEQNNLPVYVRDLATSRNIPLQIKKNTSAIMLIRNPEKISCLCKQALKNSKNNKELMALRKSRAINHIEGFPRDNFKQLVTQQISQ